MVEVTSLYPFQEGHSKPAYPFKLKKNSCPTIVNRPALEEGHHSKGVAQTLGLWEWQMMDLGWIFQRLKSQDVWFVDY